MCQEGSFRIVPFACWTLWTEVLRATSTRSLETTWWYLYGTIGHGLMGLLVSRLDIDLTCTLSFVGLVKGVRVGRTGV
nr:hypothetical protein CFP56_55127 [Quercus suber]